jgi:hypothetical protein
MAGRRPPCLEWRSGEPRCRSGNERGKSVDFTGYWQRGIFHAATVCRSAAIATHYMMGLSMGLRVLGLVGVASSPRIPCAIRDFA